MNHINIDKLNKLPHSLERYFSNYLESRHFPGAAVSIVYDGSIFLSAGYGLADIENNHPVNPHTSSFRIASLTKLFTATAIMQLFERTSLSLEDDSRIYLEDDIVKRIRDPITISQLLTHTAGLDERLISVSTKKRQDQQSLRNYLATRLPPRVMPSDSPSLYSNHGYALLGRIIENISDMTYQEYIRKNILNPLEMKATSFKRGEQPDINDAPGYEYTDGHFVRVPHDFSNIIPAGGLSSTANDMAAFMIAHLQNGVYLEQRVLQEETTKLMHRQQHRDHPHLSGITYGFFENNFAELRGLIHLGAGHGFGSLLMIFPTMKVGVFIVTNMLDEGLLYNFPRWFTRQVTEYAREEHKEIPLLPTDARKYVGFYRSNRYARRTLDKAMAIRNEVAVRLSEEGELTWKHLRGNKLRIRMIDSSDHVFQFANSSMKIAFRKNERQQITHAFRSSTGQTHAYQKICWFDTIKFQLATFIFLILGFLIISASVLITGEPANVLLRSLIAANIVLSFSFMIGLTWILKDIQRTYWSYAYGIPRTLKGLLALPILNILVVFLVAIIAALNFSSHGFSWCEVSLVCITIGLNSVFFWLLNYWNLIGWRY